MVDVYSNAHIVIAAGRSDDCNKGCFHVRRGRPTEIIDLPGGLEAVHASTLFQTDEDLLSPADRNFRGEPLSTRSWALQERVLARRVVHYNSKQLYFECAAGILAEDGSFSQNRLSDLSELRHPESDYHDTTEKPGAWYWLLRSYGGRKMTKPTDKLPAMSGLARLVQSKTNAEYVAGLWSNSMVKELAWLADGRRAPVSRDEYIGPSWSWASYDGLVSRNAAYHPSAISEVLDWHVDLKHAENPFGEVTSAWLRIRGPVVPLRPRPTDKPWCYRAGIPSGLIACTPYSKDEAWEKPILNLDYPDSQDWVEWRGWDLDVLLLYHFESRSRKIEETHDSDSSHSKRKFVGLAIRTEGAGQTSKVQRVGTVQMKGQEGFKIKEDESNWRTVVLV